MDFKNQDLLDTCDGRLQVHHQTSDKKWLNLQALWSTELSVQFSKSGGWVNWSTSKAWMHNSEKNNSNEELFQTTLRAFKKGIL